MLTHAHNTVFLLIFSHKKSLTEMEHNSRKLIRHNTKDYVVKTLKSGLPHIKFIVTLFIALLILSSIQVQTSVQSSSTQLYVDPPKVEYWTPALNQVFTINVTIANVTNLQGFDLTLYWNTTLLDLIEIEVRTFLNPPVNIMLNETREDLGRYKLIEGSTGASKDGSGPLVSLSFKITYEPIWPKNGTCILDLANTNLADSEANPISHDVFDGEYLCYSTPPLDITIATNEQSYYLLAPIGIHGNLTYGLLPVSDGLVAIQVVDPSSQTFVARTLLTGTAPTNLLVEITNVFPCDTLGNPKNSFYRGSSAYFNVSAVNHDASPRTVQFVINFFDSYNVPAGIAGINVQMGGGSQFSTKLQVEIPMLASLGNAKVYASAFTNWPSANGVAYCPEKSATFQILGSGEGGPSRTPLEENITQRSYNFTLYANSLYEGQLATSNTSFEVVVPDINNDNTVDIFDVVTVANVFGSSPPAYPPADLNQDGVVDIFDLVTVALYFGWYQA
jgi:hypothetical protein